MFILTSMGQRIVRKWQEAKHEAWYARRSLEERICCEDREGLVPFKFFHITLGLFFRNIFNDMDSFFKQSICR